MVNLISVNSYFDLFPNLIKLLKEKPNDLEKKNLVFCEAKISLMAERYICAELKGSFNTEVYSFGNYLRAKKKMENLLSKEGSAMVVKRILSTLSLNCLNRSKSGLAPTIFELIIQLKSAKITPQDLSNASSQVSGVLKNKLQDIALIYTEYENYINEQGYIDQSTALSFLPELINQSNDIKNSDVILLGYSGFTAQMRTIISTLIDRAKSVTAILLEGENPHVYVNETVNFINELCQSKKIKIKKTKIDGNFIKEGKIVVENLFSPKDISSNEKILTDKIKVLSAKNPSEEIKRVCSVIRDLVVNKKCRYKDISIALSQNDFYKDEIETTFKNLDVPYFLDEKKVPESHPLVGLILSYINAYKKGLERTELISFFKNPLFESDKYLTDAFENYLIKYNVNYGRIRKPFTFEGVSGVEVSKLEELRVRLCSHFEKFDLKKMLKDLSAKEKLIAFAESLRELGESEQASVTEQIYDAVVDIIDQMSMMLGGVELSLNEYKNVFLSGISALKLSIIPQYNDAVFIGGFKEVGLAKAKYVFAVGLTVDVPTVSNDVSLLSDSDIETLEQIKVLVEPKIRVVNHRTRENVAMALASFSDGLYLSYPIADVSGSKNVKSEILTFFNRTFTLSPFPQYDEYLTYKQGLISFARACGEFAEGKGQDGKPYDFTLPSSFYSVVGEDKLGSLLHSANKEIKTRLDGDRSLVKKVISPTTIEDYYKCPFRAFASHNLKISEREDGKVGVLSVGNLMHEILSQYVQDVYSINSKEESNALFEKIKDKVLEKDEYKKYLEEPSTFETVKRVLRECKEYAFKTYLSLRNSEFKQSKTEVGFSDNENAEFPAISLSAGQVKIKGKIDRVDIGDKYFRVVDYKTGKADSTEKSLFAGVKLQLYLYALAVQNKYKDQEKTPAGVYYLPVSDKYEKLEDKEKSLAVGKTLNDREALLTQDVEFFERGESAFSSATLDSKSGKIKNAVDKKTFDAYMNYALKISEKATEQLKEGVMIALPYQDACKYCTFSSMCEFNGDNERTLGKVDDSSFMINNQGGAEDE